MTRFRFAIITILLMTLGAFSNRYDSFAIRQAPNQTSFYQTLYFAVNTTSPPFDNVLVRYALAMATDRQTIASGMRDEKFKYIAGIGLVPPYKDYETLNHLEVTIEGNPYDVITYNPTAARELLAKAGFPEGISKEKQRLAIEVLVYAGEDTEKLTRIIKQQWEQNLGVDVKVISKKWHDYLEQKDERDFKGVALDGKALLLGDARDLLDFATGQIAKKPCWTDAKFNEMLREANRVSSSSMSEGNRKFRECEAYLLRAMAVIPLYSYAP